MLYDISMKLYAQIKLKQHVAQLRRRGVEEIPCSELARRLSDKYGILVSRSYVKWYCDTRGIPTQPKGERPTNDCIHCGEPVFVNRATGPYNKHKKCELRVELIFVDCSNPNCGLEMQRSPSLVRETNNYCNRECFNEHRALLREEKLEVAAL